MDMVNGLSRRFGSTAVRIFGVLALALLLTTAMAAHASAESNNGSAMDKAAFKTGCEAGGGSYIDNPDGSFQCNGRSGGVVECKDTTSPCTYTENQISVKGTINANAAGVLQVHQGPTPTPVGAHAGAVSANTSSAVSASAP